MKTTKSLRAETKSGPVDYRGMSGSLRPRDKRAVDGLISLMEELANHSGLGKAIKVYGAFWPIPADMRPHLREVWRIYELSFTTVIGTGMAGYAMQVCIPEAMGIIKAAEMYLEEFHTKAYRPPGWETDIDEKADARWRLEKLWKAGEKETNA